VVLKGCKGARNGAASDRELAIAGGGTGGIDETVKPIDDLTGLCSGDKVCRDPLANVGGSRRGDATITSGPDQKAGPARKVKRVHGFDRCRHRNEGCDGSESEVAKHDHPQITRHYSLVQNVRSAN
jgi:hypothetical protein